MSAEAYVSQQPSFETARLRLVPLSDEHLDYEVLLDADPEVVRYIGNGMPRTRAQVEVLHRGRLDRAKPVPGLGFWAGFLREPGSDQFVGWWILETHQDASQAELGYRLARQFWRRGLAKEGSAELLRYGFDDLGLARIFAETMAVNQASRATMASVGMRYIRTFHLDYEEKIAGYEHGEVEYAISRDEWLSGTTIRDSPPLCLPESSDACSPSEKLCAQIL
jgi:RimJ/RimL family protein N-acetyltransferase